MSRRVKRTALRNGLRVISQRMANSRSVALGLWVDVGSSNEVNQQAGISHFLEHMVFKGTTKRNAREIALSLEKRGGMLNAFTSREQTCYHARVLDQDLPIALDVLSDIVTNARLTGPDVARERHVICEEIKDADDNPSDAVHDKFTSTLWPGHPIGRPIMGSTRSVGGITRRDLLKYRRAYYRPERLVVAAAGAVDHDRLVQVVRRKLRLDFGSGNGTPITADDSSPGQRLVVQRSVNQTHVCLGMPTYPYADPRRYVLLIINNLLGGGMSSRLFQSLRERRGLVYTVYTFHDFYRELGLMGIYFGCDPAEATGAVELCLKELRRLRHQLVPGTELADIKSQLKGHLVLGLESANSRMNRIARHELVLGEHISAEQTMAEIDRITAKDIRDVSREVFDERRVSAVMLGPNKTEVLDEIDWGKVK